MCLHENLKQKPSMRFLTDPGLLIEELEPWSFTVLRSESS